VTRGRAEPEATGSRSNRFLVAAGLLNFALATYVQQGGLGPLSVALLTGAIGAATFAVLAPPPAPGGPVTTRAIAASLVLIELGMMIVFPFRPPIDVPSPTLPIAALATISLLAMLAAVVAARSGRSWWLVGVGVVWLAAIVARVLVVGADVAPNFDVPLFQEEAARLLLGGHNPYETTVIAAYPYGPVAIIGAAIGHVLGDVRWVQVGADLATAGALAWAGRRRLDSFAGAAIGAMWLWSGAGLFVIWQGFPEPLMTALLIAGAVCSRSHVPRAGLASGILVGLGAAAKQFGALPVLLLVARRGRARSIGLTALTTASLVVLPFLIANPARFLAGTVGFNINQPLRSFALNLIPLLRIFGPGTSVPPIVAVVAGTLAGLGVAWRRRSSTDWVEATVVGLMVFFVLGTISFVNYYEVPLGLLLLVGAFELKPGHAVRSQPTDQQAPTSEVRTATAETSGVRDSAEATPSPPTD
jgi:hypothetical protein